MSRTCRAARRSVAGLRSFPKSPLSYAWDLDNDGSFETPGQTVPFSAAALDGPSSHTIVIQVTDEGGLSATAQTTVEVANVAPTVGEIIAPLDPTEVDTPIAVSADFADPCADDTHTAVWDWGDDATWAGTVDQADDSVTGGHAYAEPGVYRVIVTVTDDDGDSAEAVFEFVVIYDPEGGFVTGGGRIDSPEGAYVDAPTLTGKANFGFVSNYKKGATVPTGLTEFQFKAGDLNFHSEEYQWLVVAGPQAKFKGVGDHQR